MGVQGVLYTSGVCGRAFSGVTLTVTWYVVRTLAKSLRLDTKGKPTVVKNEDLGHCCHPVKLLPLRE